ncbi:MAG: hypothetical protein ABL983_16185 [Nitrospira sp.]
MASLSTVLNQEGSLERAAEQFLQQLEAYFENDCPDCISRLNDGTHEKPRADS